jgi:hypothetical protein
MPFSDLFNDFKSQVVSNAGAQARNTLKDFVVIAEDDANAFLISSEEKLKRWAGMLAEGQLTKLEFSALVDSQKGLAVLNGLAHAGIAAAALQRFRDSLIDIVLDAAFKTFLP